MRKIATFIITVFSLTIQAQQTTLIEIPIDKETNKIVFSDIKQVDGIKKDKLFEILRTWVSTNTLIKEKNITVSDKETYEISITCKDPILYNQDGISTNFCFVSYSITFYIKDDKFKYFIRNFNHVGCERGGGFGSMKSIGELENILIVDKDRNYYDNVLRLVKQQTDKIIISFTTATKTNVNEKDF